MGRVAAMLVVLASASATARAEDEKPLWLVVTRPMFEEAIEPLAAHRRHEGFDAVITTEPPEKALAAAPRRPSFVLLVGDAHPLREGAPWRIPAPRRALYRWRAVQAKTFAADALLGDPDGDLVPDLAVGRIPARTVEEVAAAVAKILAYERAAPGLADLGLPVLGGAPGYGPRMDAMATGLLVTTVRKHAPTWASPWMISAARGQPLCGWPPDHPGLFLDRMSRGGVLAAVLAHASEDSILSMFHGGRRVLVTKAKIERAFVKGPPAPPLVLLTCLTGRFDRPIQSLAETALFRPGGPVAVIGATTESHPLTNYFTGIGMLGALDHLRGLEVGSRRLGAFWLEAQRRSHAARDGLMELMLGPVEGSLDPDIDVTMLRRDQLLMYAVLGDPATRLRVPGILRAKVTREGRIWRWTAERPAGATRLDVGYRPFGIPSTVPAKGPTVAEAARKRFELANRRFAYASRPAPEGDATWTGTRDSKGYLRLVATGPGVFRVAVLEIR